MRWPGRCLLLATLWVLGGTVSPCPADAQPMTLDQCLREKRGQLSRLAKAYDEAMAVANQSYVQDLLALMDASQPDHLRRAAAIERQRFARSATIPDEADDALPAELEQARDAFRKTRLEVDQVRLRRTLTIYDEHLRELKRLMLRESDASEREIIQNAIDRAMRIRGHLLPARQPAT